MGVIAEYMNGPCKITVYDDSIRPPDEVKKITNHVSEIIYNEQFRQYMEKKQKGTDETGDT